MATKFNDAFWKWFGDSKVVDDRGEPLVMYHGTRASFDSFDENLSGKNYGKWSANGGGIYFTSDYGRALGWGWKSRGKGDVVVLPVYLKIERPFIGTRTEFYKAKIDEIKKQNADGLFTDEFNYPHFNATVIYPKQIKSATDNDGSWDPDDPDIRSNPPDVDDEIVAATEEAREELERSCMKVAGKCYEGSEILYDKLVALGLDPAIIGGYFVLDGEDFDHTYVLVNGIIVDITADQFGDFPPIWIDPPKKYYRERFRTFFENPKPKKSRRK